MTPAAWLALFDGRAARLASDLEQLVVRESPSEDPARVSALSAWVRDRLDERGVAARTQICEGAGDAVVAEVGSDDGGALVLGHLDTVWPAGTLREIPFRVDGDRATGPGIFDMKAGVAVAMAAMEALVANGDGAATLLLVPDEEIGSSGSRALTIALARRHRRVLVLEPSDDGAAKIARKGTGLFHLRFRGRAAHAGLEPERGASALAELARAVLFLERLADAGSQTTVVPSRARSGGRTNVVPEEGELSVDVRVWSREEADRVEASIRAYRPDDPRVTVSVEGGFDRPPLVPTPESLALYERARGVARELGFELAASRVGGASDGNLTAAVGLPTLDGLGPRGGGAHARDEFVRMSDLPRRAALLCALVAADA
ncbi:MAG TPA: M20/M25/M40 family metallo-hydrolase [Thermoanaerobaculia bacterium]